MRVTRENFVAVDTQIAATATEYVTAATGEQIAIDKVLFYNTTGAGIVVDVYIDDTAATPAAANQVYKTTVAANDEEDVTALANVTLSAGQALFVKAGSATSVNLHVSGRRITG